MIENRLNYGDKVLVYGITLLYILPGHLFRPSFGDMGSPGATGYDHSAELIPEEDSYLIKVQALFL
jgi:hypothetical protein